MARPLRIEFPGALYHVTARGNRRERIYVDDADRLAWLNLFGNVCDRYRWLCYAWCLMENHYHIVIETKEANLAAGMRHLNGVYTQKTNHRHERVGHVFQGRYKGILVQKESHLLELSRYVVLNPVRAGLVSRVEDWPWTSYHAMIRPPKSPHWLHTDFLLAQFGTRRSQAVRQYIDFVRAGAQLPPIWQHLRGQIYLGSEPFMEAMRAVGPGAYDEDDRLREIPRLQRKITCIPLAQYSKHYTNRKHAMAAAYRSGDFTMREIASAFGVHYATVSRAFREMYDCKT